MFIARSLAPAAAIAVMAGALAASAAAAPAPGPYPEICTTSGKQVGNTHAPGLLKAAEHSPNLTVCYPNGGGTPT
jgi:hypothetical protein